MMEGFRLRVTVTVNYIFLITVQDAMQYTRLHLMRDEWKLSTATYKTNSQMCYKFNLYPNQTQRWNCWRCFVNYQHVCSYVLCKDFSYDKIMNIINYMAIHSIIVHLFQSWSKCRFASCQMDQHFQTLLRKILASKTTKALMCIKPRSRDLKCHRGPHCAVS